MISDVDWPELFERISLVDDVLRAGSAFRDMDFPTRNLYRSAIEELARGAESHGARRRSRCRRGSERRRHARRSASRADRRAIPAIIFSPTDVAHSRRRSASGHRRVRWPGRLSRRLGIGGYVGAGIVCRRYRSSPYRCSRCTRKVSARRGSVCLAFWALVPAIDAAVALVNRAVTRGFGATPLPALELRGGVPAHLRTIVAVPTMLTTRGGDRGADRASGGPPPREPGRRAAFRAALRLDWMPRPSTSTGMKRCSTRQSKGSPGSISATVRRLEATASCCSTASGVWNDGRGTMDRLGTQARQAA